MRGERRWTRTRASEGRTPNSRKGGKGGRTVSRNVRTGVKRAPPNPLASAFRPVIHPALPAPPARPASTCPDRRASRACPGPSASLVLRRHADVRRVQRTVTFLVGNRDEISARDDVGDRKAAALRRRRRAGAFRQHLGALVDREGLRERRAAAAVAPDRDE